MKKIQTTPLFYKNQNRLLVGFDYDLDLISKLRQIADCRWSKTNKSWHIPNNENTVKELHRIFKDVALIGEKTGVESLKPKVESIKLENTVIEKPKVESVKLKTQIHKFKQWMRQKRYSESTINSYSEVLLIFFSHYAEKRTDEITNNDILKFNVDYILQKNLSFSYQNQLVNAIKLFYKKTYSISIEIENIERPRRSKKLPKVIAKDDVMLMLKNIKNKKHQMALTMTYACGLRRSELLNMKLEHLNSKRKNVTIFNGKGQKDRVLPLSDKLMEQIKKYECPLAYLKFIFVAYTSN